MSSTYIARLNQLTQQKKTAALVGLDPRFDQLPEEIVKKAKANHSDPNEMVAAAFEEFCKRLIDVVAPLVPAVKPQAAFYEEWGPAGSRTLCRVIQYARKQGLLVICDGKRNDIGSTATAYAHAYLAGSDPEASPWGADALTVNPYMGSDTLEPFIKVAKERGAGLYVLVRTSNPGSGRFQNLEADGKPIYEHVAAEVEAFASQAELSEGYSSIGAVVGATYPAELEALRTQMPHVPFLVPGYGSQGGTSADVASAFDTGGLGALINSSRGINFAYNKPVYQEKFGPDQWEEAVHQATLDMIDDLATHTPVKALG
ncbi:Orotidine 5'-phosphate decarboxylase [Polystyrenella longa]|uniref:Orotidine 5'-phosphate decarboxylase n=2 Tax=Polystyrenella longa TaxID=2528007 RepID=A0A518CQ52_9PLAN|nr:Orotidine 5'-phosphate decarboxylase [Polystyrenella longa]